ncbi:hypothetical protein KC19_VG007600 [Ceratodon purpureus]|uniref:Uncharacterized protein n=1 Tax=Ceratodon purpureus TaxID=3225 RepID=A0A8T0HKR8_CERPU|nr:hypothetical protein KC19_VG007600 [Ceratodon purpureus]
MQSDSERRCCPGQVPLPDSVCSHGPKVYTTFCRFVVSSQSHRLVRREKTLTPRQHEPHASASLYGGSHLA